MDGVVTAAVKLDRMEYGPRMKQEGASRKALSETVAIRHSEPFRFAHHPCSPLRTVRSLWNP